MKFIHLSDLHIGKKLNECSLMDDQKYILMEIINIIDREKPDGVIIAGDVYDKGSPSAEAVALFDNFLVWLAERHLQVFIISGNHDCPERVAFGGRIMKGQGVHLSPVYDGKVLPIKLTDEYGPVNVYMLPFVRPANVRRYYQDEKIESYTDAVSCAIAQMNVNTDERNVLVTHQFVTGAARSESEDVSVGGTDNVDASVFAPFDYVALGHLHSPQRCERDTIRYCGTPLKYSFSEVDDQKSVTVLELGAKGDAVIRTVPLIPQYEMYKRKGTYAEFMNPSYYKGTDLKNAYLHITLTDEEEIPDAMPRLRNIYHNLLQIDVDNQRTRAAGYVGGVADVERKTPLELFAELFEMQNGRAMTEEENDVMRETIEKVWEENA